MGENVAFNLRDVWRPCICVDGKGDPDARGPRVAKLKGNGVYERRGLGALEEISQCANGGSQRPPVHHKREGGGAHEGGNGVRQIFP